MLDLRDEFARDWYRAAERGEMRLTWRGRHLLKCPMDLMVYAELIHRVRPALIIETGTYSGASAQFLMDMSGLDGPPATVITIDVTPPPGPVLPPIFFIHGSSVYPMVVGQVEGFAARVQGPVMVILDSNHMADHVKAELDAYAPLVTPGSYVIVEDSNIHGHPVWVSSPQAAGEDPTAGLERWLAEQPAGMWEQDRSCERFWLTHNPGGFIKRLR